MLGKPSVGGRSTVIAAAALLFAAGLAFAQQNAAVFPWHAQGYQGYNESPAAMRIIDPSAVPVAPERYQMYANVLPVQSAENTDRVTLVAHVPDNAQVSIGDAGTTSTGTLRTYLSPPVAPGSTYSYSVRVDWVEAGKKVTQTETLPVKAGGMYCVYLVRKGSKIDPEPKTIAANIAKLSADDQKLARGQKYCAVQEGMRLGSMGPPTKVMVNGQPVFLCCEACVRRAQSNPDATLAKVRALRANAGAAPKK